MALPERVGGARHGLHCIYVPYESSGYASFAREPVTGIVHFIRPVMSTLYRLSPIALACLLAACSSSDTAEGNTEDAVATTGPSAYRITPEGFGELRAGMSVAEANSAVGGTFALAAEASTECSYAQWGGAPAGVRVMVERDTVVRIEVKEAGVSTREGARVGDNEGRINSLYTGRVFIRPHKYTTGKYMIVMPPAGADTMYRMVFETDGEKVTEFRSGRMPSVEYVEGCS